VDKRFLLKVTHWQRCQIHGRSRQPLTAGCRSALEGERGGGGTCKEPRWEGNSQTPKLLAEALLDLIASALTVTIAKKIEMVSIQSLAMSCRAQLRQKKAVLRAGNTCQEGWYI